LQPQENYQPCQSQPKYPRLPNACRSYLWFLYQHDPSYGGEFAG